MTLEKKVEQSDIEVQVQEKAKKEYKYSGSTVVSKTAQVLRHLRKQRKLTLGQLANMCGLSPSYISRLEAADRRLNSEIAYKIADALGCSGDELFRLEFSESGVITSSFKKNLPLYRVLSEGVGVSNNPYSVIVFSEPMDHYYSTQKIASSPEAFCVYAVNEENAPKYSVGDMLFFYPVESFEKEDFVMVVDNKSHIFIGLLDIVNDVHKISTLSGVSYEVNSEDVVKIYKLSSVEFK